MFCCLYDMFYWDMLYRGPRFIYFIIAGVKNTVR